MDHGGLMASVEILSGLHIEIIAAATSFIQIKFGGTPIMKLTTKTSLRTRLTSTIRPRQSAVSVFRQVKGALITARIFWVKTITGNEQLSCSELTGIRARWERCCRDLERRRRASGSGPAGGSSPGAGLGRRAVGT